MRKLILLFILSLFISESFGQIKFGLLVIDSLTNLPIGGATIEVFGTSETLKSSSFITDKTGFLAVNVKDPVRSFLVTYVGYQTKEIAFNTKILNVLTTIKLEKSLISLKEVTISGVRSPVSITAEGYNYTLDDKLRDLNVNATSILKTLPGVIPNQNGELKIMDKNVAIWIDGKPSNLSGEELNQYLTSLNLNDVKEFKVLTNPSSEYSATGGAIIDISLKKQVFDGLLYRIDGAIGTHDKYNSGLSIDYKSKKYTGKYSVNYNHNNLFDRSEYSQTNLGSNKTFYNFLSRTNENPTSNLNLSLNNYYAFNEAHTIGLVLKYNRFDSDPSVANSTLRISDINNTTIENRISSRIDESTSNVYYSNLNYRGRLSKKGTYLDAELFYWNRDALSNFNFIQKLESSVLSKEGTSNDAKQNMSLKGFNLKLTHPISKAISMTAGGQFSSFLIAGQFDNKIYNENTENFDYDDNSSFLLDYTEHLYSGFFNFSGTYKKIRYSVGLRAEENVIKLITDQSIQNTFNRNRNFGLYPNLGVVYSLSKIKLFTFAYNRKIWRVSYSQLNPINTSSDPTNINQGNPDLTPSKADTYTLGFNIITKRPIMLSLAFMHETNPYMWITLPGTEAGSFVTKPRNFNYTDYLTFSLYNKQPITKQLSLSLNVSTSISFLNLENLGLPNPDSYVNVKATLTANYNFWKNAGIQLFGNFKTRSISAFGSMGNYQYIDFAFSKRISSKLSANLTITDIFNLNEFTYKNSSPFLINSGFNKRETRIGKISFSYSFGKTKENKVNEYDPYADSRTQN